MRRGKLIFFIMLLAALFLAAPALAQEPARRPLSLPMASIDGMTPEAIICMEARQDGSRAEVARTPWNGGAMPADACPPETDLFQAYILKAWPGIAPPAAPPPAAGGND